MLRSANLESRQSSEAVEIAAAYDAPLREFGIKAKPTPAATTDGAGCSAPRIWNQGKAATPSTARRRRMLRSANLESRQSVPGVGTVIAPDAPLREFGIKAKREGRPRSRRGGCSAPRIWNQGKARRTASLPSRRMLRSANLESRQSQGQQVVGDVIDAPLREFGIKAKHADTEHR